MKNSWISCAQCTAMAPNPMHQNLNVLRNKWHVCASKEHGSEHIPVLSYFSPLRNLHEWNQQRLAMLLCGSTSYQTTQHGNRVKTCGFSAESKPNTVQERIDATPDLTRKRKLQHAYDFLLTHPNSHYRHFIRMQNSGQFPSKMHFYLLFRISFVETALQPVLYVNDFLCESTDDPTTPPRRAKNSCSYRNAFSQTSTTPRSFPFFISITTVGSISPSVAHSTLLSNAVCHRQLFYLLSPTVIPAGVGNTPCS